MNRRGFAMTLVSSAALVSSRLGSAALIVDDNEGLSDMSQQAFAQRVQQLWSIEGVDQPNHIDATLEAVESVGRSGQFVVRFSANNSNQAVREGLYALSTPDREPLLLHLQTSPDRADTLTAVINRI